MAAAFVLVVALSETVQEGVKSAFRYVLRTIQHTPVIIFPNGHALAAVEVERYSSLPAALELSPAIMSGIIENLNRPGFHRFEVNSPAGEPVEHGVYAVRPRPGLEKEFGELEIDVLGRLRLYEVHVPSTWSNEELDEMKIVWAYQCGVTTELIDLWSEFTPRRHENRVNECRLGGRCLIVSEGCNQRILSGKETEG